MSKKNMFSRYFLFLAAALCLFVLSLLSFSYLNNSSHTLSPDITNWESRYISYDNGWIFDERIMRENDLSEEENLEFIYGPFMPLTKGSYCVTVRYSTEYEQTLRIYAFENEDNILIAEPTVLHPEGKEVCYSFDLLENVDNFEIRVCYDGIGYVNIKDISVHDHLWKNLYYIRNLLAVSAILFLALGLMNLYNSLFVLPDGHRFWMDLVKGIGILCVFFGHTDNNPYTWIIYGFHMPLFFIISGILYKNESLGRFCTKLIKRYIIPYLIFCFANSLLRIPYMFVGNYTFGGIMSKLVHYWTGSLKGVWREMPNCMPLWFLPALALSLLLFRLICYIPFKSLKILIICLSGLTGFLFNTLASRFGIPDELPWGLHTVFMDISLIASGYGIRKYILDKPALMETLTKKKKIPALIFAYLIGTGSIIINHIFFADTDIYFNAYGNILLMYSGAVFTSMAVILTCMILDDRIKNTNLLAIIGCNSLFFFSFDFWGKTLAMTIPKVASGNKWITVFILKTVFIFSLFVFWKCLYHGAGSLNRLRKEP